MWMHIQQFVTVWLCIYNADVSARLKQRVTTNLCEVNKEPTRTTLNMDSLAHARYATYNFSYHNIV